MSMGRINLDLSVPPVTQRPQRVALIVGIVFGIASIVGVVLAPDQFFRSYLLGWTLGMGLSLGCMAFIMLYYVTGGIWGQPIRRPLEAGMRNIWFMMVLFIPILFQLKRLYPWARPQEIAHDEHLLHIVHQYLRPELFWVRTAIYFAIWGILVYTLSRWSSLQDVPPEKDFAARFRNLSAPGLVLYGFTITFASIDWVMSLDPRWASTIYGLLFLAGQGLSAICFVVIIVVWLWKYSPMRELLKPDYLQDHGKLMITFVMLWAYFTLSQWLITWSGNLPDEIRWYMPRTHNGWQGVGYFLVIFHFFVPFFLLLSRPLKRTPQLAYVAILLLFMRWVDMFWYIEPNFPDHQTRFHLSPQDVVVPIAIAAFWLFLYFRNLRSRPLFAPYDPHTNLLVVPEHHPTGTL
jgi:hypothetical protein